MQGNGTILVTGASGFCGRHLVRRLGKAGHLVKALSRTPAGADALMEHLGNPENVVPVLGALDDHDALRRAMEGVEAVAHLVGIIRETGKATFERIHVEGTDTLVSLAKEMGVRKFYHQSALGADAQGSTRYQVTKAQAEEIVRDSGIDHVIFQPSVIVGPDGDFVATMVDLLKKAPLVPVFGDGEYGLQPIWVGDLTACIQQALERREIRNLTVCLGGPEVLSFNKMLMIVGEVLGIRKTMIHIPEPLVKSIVQPMLVFAEHYTELLPVTADQLTMLAEGSTCNITEMRHLFGLDPMPFKEAFERAVGVGVAV